MAGMLVAEGAFGRIGCETKAERDACSTTLILLQFCMIKNILFKRVFQAIECNFVQLFSLQMNVI